MVIYHEICTFNTRNHLYNYDKLVTALVESLFYFFIQVLFLVLIIDSLFFLTIIYSSVWERQRAKTGGRYRGRGRSRGSLLLSREPDAGAQSQDLVIMTWPEGRHLTYYTTRSPNSRVIFPSSCSWFLCPLEQVFTLQELLHKIFQRSVVSNTLSWTLNPQAPGVISSLIGAILTFSALLLLFTWV